MKNKKYLLFQFTDRNSGYYFLEVDNLKSARDRAKMWDKCRIDGPNRTFELYEKGVKTEWSTNLLK